MSAPAVPTRRPQPRDWAFDAFVAAGLTGLCLMLFASVSAREGGPSNEGLAVALLMVHGGCLLWRRRAPVPVMAVNLASGVAFYALGYPTIMLGVAVLVALYSVASLVDRVRSSAALAAAVVAMAASFAFGDSRGDASTIVGNAVVLVVTWFLGDSQRARRSYVADLEQRTAELERARDELAQAAVAEERLRIARELHDVVAHSMGMIAVQAGVGAHVIDTQPAAAKQSLETIEQASKSALGEIRRMLGLLRSPGERAAIAPSPGLDDLSRLAEESSGAGLVVDLHVAQPPMPLPAGIGLTIYRIVQEAITNAVRHSGAGTVRVSVWFGDGRARVAIVDDGKGAPATVVEGHGITGMRERVAMHGGTLGADRDPAGGFRVEATIPLESGEDAQ